jgi:prepilin-type N-terminal cleavage/methylation domain-containing protein
LFGSHTEATRSGAGRSVACGFTLIEIMIAIGLLALIITAIFSTWTAIIRSSKVGRDSAAAVQRARITVRIIEDSLGSAQCFLKNVELYGFVAENGDEPVLSFVARLAKSFPRSGKFGDLDLRRLEFSVQKGPGSSKELVLRQRPLLMEFDQEEKDNPLVLARNLRALEMHFYDRDKRPTESSPDDWPDEWPQTNKIPALVQVTLKIGDNATASSAEEIITRIVSIPSVPVRPEYQMPPVPGMPGNQGQPGNPNAPIQNPPSGQGAGATKLRTP